MTCLSVPKRASNAILYQWGRGQSCMALNNRERAAAPGKFCIWVEGPDGQFVPRPEQFGSLEDAVAVGEQLAAGGSQVIVYDDKGDYQRRWGERF